jgi:hypothetical protein
MSNNTKARSEQLNALAAEIAAREHIDPNNWPDDNRAYIAEISERGNCITETARSVWARWRMRHYIPGKGWGGSGRGQGRK